MRGSGGDGATLTVNFEIASLVVAYQLTTANDYPVRDPTNWTLACLGVVGGVEDENVTVISVVGGVTPPAVVVE